MVAEIDKDAYLSWLHMILPGIVAVRPIVLVVFLVLVLGTTTNRGRKRVNAPPAEREASGSPLEGGEDNYRVHLNPKSLAQNWT